MAHTHDAAAGGELREQPRFGGIGRACTDDTGCAVGYKCKPVASASSATIYGNYCVPATRSCE